MNGRVRAGRVEAIVNDTPLLLTNEVTGTVTWLGTVLGGVGLWATHRQARSAKRAAREASAGADQAKAAVEQLQRQLSVANVAYLQAQLETVRLLAGSSDFRTAGAIFISVKRSALGICRTVSIVLASETIEAEIQGLRRNLKAVETQLETGAADPKSVKPVRLTNAIAGLSELLGDWENRAIHPNAG